MFLFESDNNSGCYGNLKMPLTYNGKKRKLPFIAIYMADILTKVLQKCSLSSTLLNLRNISFLSKPLNLISSHGNRKSKFAGKNEKKKKIISSEAISGIKLKR